MHAVFWLRIGSVWGFMAVAMGAFGAHVLQDRFRAIGDNTGTGTAERLQSNFHTAAQYHMYCALAILVTGALAAAGRRSPALEFAGWSFLLGSLIFSGSLYVLSVTGLRWLGMITPIGGIGMLIGWAALAVAAGVGAAPPIAPAP
jgi:uncharacterized membrane protein YgdD (TMEM256/DUF423 family)